MSEGRIHVLNNGRSPAKRSGDLITRGEADAIVAAAIAEYKNEQIEICDHYAAQVPGLVATMIGEILHANGMILKAPEHWQSIPAVAPTQEPQSGDAAAPTDAEGPEA